MTVPGTKEQRPLHVYHVSYGLGGGSQMCPSSGQPEAPQHAEDEQRLRDAPVGWHLWHVVCPVSPHPVVCEAER